MSHLLILFVPEVREALLNSLCLGHLGADYVDAAELFIVILDEFFTMLDEYIEVMIRLLNLRTDECVSRFTALALDALWEALRAEQWVGAC